MHMGIIIDKLAQIYVESNVAAPCTLHLPFFSYFSPRASTLFAVELALVYLVYTKATSHER